VWPAQHPRIYAELARLAEAGLIEVDSHGPRRRTAYRITDAGLAEVRGWLAGADVDHTFRLETLLRAYFFWLMEPAELAAHLERERRFYAETAATLRSWAAAKDRGELGTDPRVRAARVAIEAGIRLNDALVGWADWVREHAPMTSGGFGAAGGTAGGAEGADDAAAAPREG
jgi:DNA-binding PadR family transcriptional regulator